MPRSGVRSPFAPPGPLVAICDTQDLGGHLISGADGATGATLREYIWLASNNNEPVDVPLALVSAVNTAPPVLSMVHADHLGRPHLNLFVVNQNPNDCRYRWNKRTKPGDVAPLPPDPAWVDLNGGFPVLTP